MADDKPATVSVYREAGQEWLTLDSRFSFRCHAGLACFNQCCRTATILLSPYDILRLARGLGLTTGEVLKRYTRREVESHANLPLAFIDLSRSPGGGCPLAGPNGCQVYPHRPAACRLFPITMGSRLTEQGIEDFYFCRKLEFCQGFEAGPEWTVASWRANQGFAEYDEARREWLEILLRQGRRGPLAADAGGMELIAAIMYDLDAFRRMAGEPHFREICGLAAEDLATLKKDEVALLTMSCRVLKDMLETEGGLAEIQSRLAPGLNKNAS
jgi:Fe-S-cluster containining protein